MGNSKMKKQKSTLEIRELLEQANVNFEFAVNEALNNYLPKIFQSCPFTEELCTKKQCMDCNSAKMVHYTQKNNK
jgi:hypothetical protein